MGFASQFLRSNTMTNFPSLRALLLGALLCTTAAMTPAYSQQTVGERLDDTVTLTKVKAALIGDPELSAREIHVDVLNGRVQLNGFVDTDIERSRAMTVAAKVAGVKAVDNNLEVQKSIRTAEVVIDDAATTTKVKAALIADKRTKAREINVITRQGVVQLDGFVSTDAERDAAAEIARSVSGVSRVDNQIALK
jgi:hyperosmotically inducible protein